MHTLEEASLPHVATTSLRNLLHSDNNHSIEKCNLSECNISGDRVTYGGFPRRLDRNNDSRGNQPSSLYYMSQYVSCSVDRCTSETLLQVSRLSFTTCLLPCIFHSISLSPLLYSIFFIPFLLFQSAFPLPLPYVLRLFPHSYLY
jgi:hypothetical protein